MVLKILGVEEQHLRAYICHVQPAHHCTQVLHSTCTSSSTIADEPSRLTVPLIPQVIDGVLEYSGNAVIVFTSHKYIGTIRSDLIGPEPGDA